MNTKRKFLIALSIIILLLASGYLLKGERTNPPVTSEVKWNDKKTESLFNIVCADCHSNKTRWPWYSNFAPISWIISSNVEKGRRVLNISDGNLKNAPAAGEHVAENVMPPTEYKMMHPSTWLNEENKSALIVGLNLTFKKEHDDTSEDGHHHDH